MARQHISKKIEEQRQEQAKRDEERKKEKEVRQKSTQKTKIIICAVGVIAIILIGYFTYSSSAKLGVLDDFAKCMTGKGVIMYGAIEWCSYTKDQAALFGKSFKHVDYRDYGEGPDIKITPTWVIYGEKYEKVHSLPMLAELTGCKLPEPQ